MKISKKERLFLLNQYHILASLKTNESSYYEELIEILENGYEFMYYKLDEWISEDMPSDEGKFVFDILDLYRAIETVKRTTKNQELITHNNSYFLGFDGNNETEYMSFARFVIEKLGRFNEQEQYLRKNDNLNSHAPMVDKYKKMLAEADKLESIWDMNTEEALRIIKS